MYLCWMTRSCFNSTSLHLYPVRVSFETVYSLVALVNDVRLTACSGLQGCIFRLGWLWTVFRCLDLLRPLESSFLSCRPVSRKPVVSFVVSRKWNIVGCQLETLLIKSGNCRKNMWTQSQENTPFASSLLLITFKRMPICATPQSSMPFAIWFAQAPSQGSCTAWCKSSRWSQSGARVFWFAFCLSDL